MEQRRNQIVELVNRKGSISFAQLKEAFPSVSEMTLRTDLKALDEARRVVRVHGGAVLKASARPYWELSKRLDDKRPEKTEVSRLAANYIKNGDSIAIDTGSTAIEFIETLMERFDTLTIVTHSMDVFQKAHDF